MFAMRSLYPWLQVGQVMEQVDARCPQALKSPSEDEVDNIAKKKLPRKLFQGPCVFCPKYIFMVVVVQP